MVPEVIRSGNKLFEVYVAGTKQSPQTYFRDSYLFMPDALSELVGAYDLQVENKPFFPHLYNTPQNYYKRRSTLPPAKYYQPDAMKPDKRDAFWDWYNKWKDWEKKTGTKWCLDKVLREYCNNDVDILIHAMMAFRKEWISITHDDCFRNGVSTV